MGEFSSGKGRWHPGGLDARGTLFAALTAAVGEHASAIVDALDVYLEEDPADRVPVLENLTPNRFKEREAARKQLDEAVARAEKAERELRAAKKKSTLRRVGMRRKK